MPKTPVIASMATMPGRERQLQTTLAHLCPQVDRLVLYINADLGCDVPPYDNLEPVWYDDASGDIGDVGKIAACNDLVSDGQTIRLLCDDDIIYPPTYVARMVAALQRLDYQQVVGVHGKRIPGRVQSYYRGVVTLHCRQALPADTPVHLLGTGTVAYHTSTLRLHHAQFPVPNMADIWLGLLCQRLRLGMVAIARPAAWLTVLDCPDTIWDRAHMDDGLQTALVNSRPWRLWA